MDHFWIILGPFSTILFIVLCANGLCQWSCGLVHHFLEAKLLKQVNLHFWIIYNTYKFIVGSICGLVLALCHTYVWKLRFWIIFVNMNGWMISFLELTFLDHIFSTQIGGSFLFWNLLIN